MGFWFRFRKENTGIQFRQEKIERSVLTSLLQFLETLKLPDGSTGIRAQMWETHSSRENCLEGRMGRREFGSAPYCLLLYAKEGRSQYLNAGYAAGQAEALLRFQGIAASVLREFPERRKDAEHEKELCSAALAFGRRAAHREVSSDSYEEAFSCFCSSDEENWVEEVLALAKKRCPQGNRHVRIVKKNGELQVMQKESGARRTAASEFEAGLALAAIMTAAEALWIDLEMECSPVQQRGNSQYLVSVRKRPERKVLMQRSEETCGTEICKKSTKEQRWGYA